MHACRKLVSHVHLPVQSGSDRMLAAMKRGYTVLEYKSIVRRLRAVRPDICVSSDFIVGFPGETEARLRGHAAAGGRGRTSTRASASSTAAARARRRRACRTTRRTRSSWRACSACRTVLNRQAQAISQAMVGHAAAHPGRGAFKKDPGELSGRTENNRVVNFPGAPRLVGQLLDVHITAALPHSLRGDLALKPAA